MARNHHARAKTRDWECHWFRTTLLPRLNSSETHGFATDCTVKLFIIKNLFSAGSLRCRLWNGASIPSICLFSITTFWGSKPADAPVVKNILHSQRHPRQPSSLGESPSVYSALVINRFFFFFWEKVTNQFCSGSIIGKGNCKCKSNAFFLIIVEMSMCWVLQVSNRTKAIYSSVKWKTEYNSKRLCHTIQSWFGGIHVSQLGPRMVTTSISLWFGVSVCWTISLSHSNIPLLLYISIHQRSVSIFI